LDRRLVGPRAGLDAVAKIKFVIIVIIIIIIIIYTKMCQDISFNEVTDYRLDDRGLIPNRSKCTYALFIILFTTSRPSPI
jgi:hypothetical protein